MTKKMSVDLELVRALAELLAESDLSEIEIEEEDTRIRLARGTTQISAPVQMMAPPAAVAHASAPLAAAPEAKSAAAPSGEPVKSPMVGTAYLAASPDTAPFVQVGDTVKKGQAILIVEAMKTMNQISAPRDGTVSEIRVTDGQPVEFGEILMTLA